MLLSMSKIFLLRRLCGTSCLSGTLSPEAALRSNMGLTKKRLFEASRCFCVSKIPDHA